MKINIGHFMLKERSKMKCDTLSGKLFLRTKNSYPKRYRYEKVYTTKIRRARSSL